MHNTERLHLPIIQCLANDNSPVFIDPYNAGTALHGHCGLLSTVLVGGAYQLEKIKLGAAGQIDDLLSKCS